MGIFSGSKPYTAITTETNLILNEGGAENSARIVNLVELTQMSATGGSECGRILRKTLKHGTQSQQLHAISLVETLIENGVKSYPLIIQSGLDEQLIRCASSYTVSKHASLGSSAKVARSAHRLLQIWSRRVNDKYISNLYTRAGFSDNRSSFVGRSPHPDDDLDSSLFNTGSRGSRGSQGSPFDDPGSEDLGNLSQKAQRIQRSQRNHKSWHPDDDLDDDLMQQPISTNSESRRFRPEKPAQRKRYSTHPDEDLDDALYSPNRSTSGVSLRSSRSGRSVESESGNEGRNRLSSMFRRSKANDKHASITSRGSNAPQEPLNLRAESITSNIANAHNTSTRLVNAVIADATSKDALMYYRQAKQIRKVIVQLVNDPSDEVQEFIGQLLNANEELIAALQSYDAVIDNEDGLETQEDHERVTNKVSALEIKPLRAPPSPPKSAATYIPDEDTNLEANPFGDDSDRAEPVALY
ncbi:hypothetical protein DASB73_008860 [Starmerella bacillaris]|uniref:VHS domain-containing protein n=1 Tax=Starmerella bacillaris TaxID=1247836 RepID=A0AAV5RFN2_STABA|nr:hypothetical protein DASB73_008860 [Starmerella bacillaris]